MEDIQIEVEGNLSGEVEILTCLECNGILAIRYLSKSKRWLDRHKISQKFCIRSCKRITTIRRELIWDFDPLRLLFAEI